MKSTRILVAAAMAACVSYAAIVSAQTFPTKAVRVVVPQAPGGASDALARIIGQRLSDRWHQPVVVENRAGAGGLIGTDVVARPPPTVTRSFSLTMGLTPSVVVRESGAKVD